MSEPTSGNPGDLPPPAAAPALTGDPVPGPVPAQAGDPMLAALPAVPEPGLPVPYAPVPAAYLQPGYPFTAGPYPGPSAPYPVTAVPYPYALPAAPPRGRAGVIVLGIATGVLVLAAGALGALWFLDHDRAAQASADQQAQIEGLREQVAQVEEDLEEAETQLQRVEDDLLAAQACPEAVQAFVALANEAALAEEGEAPSPQVERAATEMIIACDATP